MINKPIRMNSLTKGIAVFIAFTLLFSMLLSGCAFAPSDPAVTDIETEPPKEAEDTSYEPLSYDELLSMLNDIIEKKNFCDGANTLIRDTFDSVYRNYGSWEGKYRDMPSVDKFIIDNLIVPLEDLQQFLFFYEDSEEAQKYIEEGCPAGYTEVLDNGGMGIFIIASPPDTSSEPFKEFDRIVLLHELAHCNQGADSKKQYELGEYEKYEGAVISFSVEGASTFFQRFAGGYTDLVGAYDRVLSSDRLNELQYSNINCIGCYTELNMFTKYVYLVGYEVMYKWHRNELSFAQIAEMICEKYGPAGRDFLEKSLEMSDFVISEDKWRGDEAYNLCIEAEKAFLDCIYSDIKNASAKEELLEAERLYMAYMESALPVAIKLDYPEAHESKHITDITDTLFNTDYIDKLIQKRKTEFSD